MLLLLRVRRIIIVRLKFTCAELERLFVQHAIQTSTAGAALHRVEERRVDPYRTSLPPGIECSAFVADEFIERRCNYERLDPGKLVALHRLVFSFSI